MCPKPHWLVALALTTAAAVWVAPASATEEAARRYFKNGVDLITASQPNYQDAYYQFQLAYRESGESWKVLGNLGLCALKLERDEEAAQHYEAYLRLGGDGIAPEERNAIEQDLLLLRGNWATVQISSPVPELKLIDERTGSSAPAQPYALKGGSLELRLRAGNHRITAIQGEKRTTWEIVLEPKGNASHVFDFSAQPNSSGARAADSGKGTAVPGNGLRYVSYAAVGLGAVGLGLGGYFAWRSSDYAKGADDAFACNSGAGGCNQEQRGRVRELEEDRDRAKTRAIIAFAAGGALAATGVTLLVLSGHEDRKASEARVAPWVSYGSAGLWGRF